MNELDEQVLITAPCQDEGYELIMALIQDLAKTHPEQFIYHAQLGQKRYVNAMRYCKFMLGNSSSGIIESASIPTPVINLGDRQKGRERAGNVIDSSWEKEELLKAYESLAEFWGRQAPAWQKVDSNIDETAVLPREPLWGRESLRKNLSRHLIFACKEMADE